MDRHKTREATCRVCGKTFQQRRDGRPQTCSRTCARTTKGGRYRTGHGYWKVLAKGHPAADNGGYMLEHRLVMEQKLGRLLAPNERVHHKNGVRDDNRPDNLELWAVKPGSLKDPNGARVKDLIAYAMEQPELTNMDRESIEAAFRRVFLGEG